MFQRHAWGAAHLARAAVPAGMRRPCRTPPLTAQRVPLPLAELMERWAHVLALPQLQRFTEAAWHCEHGAVQATTAQAADQILER